MLPSFPLVSIASDVRSAPAVFCCFSLDKWAALLYFWLRQWRGTAMHAHSNPERRVVSAWLVIGVLALLAIALPLIVDMNMMGGGYALQFVSFFVLIMAIIYSVASYVGE